MPYWRDLPNERVEIRSLPGDHAGGWTFAVVLRLETVQHALLAYSGDSYDRAISVAANLENSMALPTFDFVAFSNADVDAVQ